MKIPEKLADAILQACDDSAEEIRRIVSKLDPPLNLDPPEISAVIFKHIRGQIVRLPAERGKS